MFVRIKGIENENTKNQINGGRNEFKGIRLE